MYFVLYVNDKAMPGQMSGPFETYKEAVEKLALSVPNHAIFDATLDDYWQDDDGSGYYIISVG